jgi:hypothetical protein
LHRDDVVLDVAARSKPGVGAEPLETLLLQPLSESLAENLDQIAGPERVWTGLATLNRCGRGLGIAPASR